MPRKSYICHESTIYVKKVILTQSARHKRAHANKCQIECIIITKLKRKLKFFALKFSKFFLPKFCKALSALLKYSISDKVIICLESNI